MSRKQSADAIVIAQRDGARAALAYFNVFEANEAGHEARERFLANKFPLWRSVRLSGGLLYRLYEGKLEYSQDGGDTWSRSMRDADKWAKQLEADALLLRGLLTDPVVEPSEK